MIADPTDEGFVFSLMMNIWNKKVDQSIPIIVMTPTVHSIVPSIKVFRLKKST